MGKITVVRYHHKPGGVLVKPSGGKKPLSEKLRRNKLQKRVLRRVFRCGNVALWLIEYNIYVLIFAYFVAAEKNFVIFTHFIIGKLYYAAVYGNLAAGNGGFYILAGKVRSVRYVFVKALRRKNPPFAPPFSRGLDFRCEKA